MTLHDIFQLLLHDAINFFNVIVIRMHVFSNTKHFLNASELKSKLCRKFFATPYLGIHFLLKMCSPK